MGKRYKSRNPGLHRVRGLTICNIKQSAKVSVFFTTAMTVEVLAARRYLLAIECHLSVQSLLRFRMHFET